MSQPRKFSYCEIGNRNWVIMEPNFCSEGWRSVATVRSEYQAKKLVKLLNGERDGQS